MLHLIKYSFLSKLKRFDTVFWPLAFPLLLATLFYFAFGNISDADFETVPVAVVKEDSGNSLFLTFLKQAEKSEEAWISVEEMDRDEALLALEEEKVSGVYFVGENLSLTVAKNGISESILQALLESYQNGKSTILTVLREHPTGILAAVRQMFQSSSLVREVSLGGKTINGNAQFFYALIGMACLYGCFIGMSSAIELQANLSALAARRGVSPTHKLKLILTEEITAILLGYADVIVLILYLRYVLKMDFTGQMGQMFLVAFLGSVIGVSMGLFVGSLGKMKEGAKTGILLAISMTGSFLAGLMSNTMKNLVDRNLPFLNRINPAALISDAFYCINVYDDPVRYSRNLIILGCMSAVLVAGAFLLVRRDSYDSI